MNPQVKDLRDFYIEALINVGYYDKDLYNMKTEDLSKLYYKKLRNYICKLSSSKKSTMNY